MIWTDEAVEELKKMWDKGMTTGQIAKVLGVTKNSIIGKVHRLCLTARPSPIKKSTGQSNSGILLFFIKKYMFSNAKLYNIFE